MKFYLFAILSIFSLIIFSKNVIAGEQLIKYNHFYLTNPATGLRLPDADIRARSGIDGQRFKYPGGDGNVTSYIMDPNSPQVGYTDDCYPDDPDNPKGNILISGRIISNFTNKPINGAVVAVYMGAEQTNTKNDPGFTNTGEFLHGGKDVQGRLTNLYTYDVTKDGFYTVYACNDYKELSTERLKVLEKESPFWFSEPSNGPCKLDGYTGNSGGCTHFDYVKAYPRFTLSVICGLYNPPSTANSTAPAPMIGEILSIDNYNDAYKSANPPGYMYKNNYDIRVNCNDNLNAFPVPSRLDYSPKFNVASCRLDDISPDLRNYFIKVREPLKNDFYPLTKYTIPTSSVIPDDSNLSCSNPDDIFCLKNFLTKSFPKPENGKNIYDYGDKTYLDPTFVSPNLVNRSLSYDTNKVVIKSDMVDNENLGNDIIAQGNSGDSATNGQMDAKVDIKSSITDYKFDLNVLKELYACFTTFNAPAVRSSAYVDEVNYRKTMEAASRLPAGGTLNVQDEYRSSNLRIPTCRELYCGTEFVPDNEICKVKKPNVLEKEYYGLDFSTTNVSEQFYQINALSGYGPGITLNFRSLEEISNDLLVLSKELINSDFNPKKSFPGKTLLYRPVNKVSDIVACIDDNNNPVFLNDATNSSQKEGSITYRYGTNQQKTFFSPVPLISFLSIPYQMELFHSVEGDNYANFNKANPDKQLLFPEQCNPDVPFAMGADSRYDQQFANCRTAVIPGGVYSVSALRIISKYCSEVVKIPTPDSANIPIGSPDTSKKIGSQYNLSARPSMEIDLSVTKIGTPLSLCLCSANDKDCNYNSRLNNAEITTDFAISSFVGSGNQFQNGGAFKNVLGYRCDVAPGKINVNSDGVVTRVENNPRDGREQKVEEYCLNQITNVDEWEIANNPSNNFIGGNQNLKVQWPFAFPDTLNDNAHLILNYIWGGNEKPTNSIVYKREENQSYSNNPVTLSNDISDGTVKCYDGYLDTDEDPDKAKCSKPASQPTWGGLGLSRNPYLVSAIDNPNAEFEDESQVNEVPKLIGESKPNGSYISGNLRFVQKTVVANIGDAEARFRYRNAKYDPIPDLLNDFSRYTVVGYNAGDYCKTPKIASLVDIKDSNFNSVDLDDSDLYNVGKQPSSTLQNYSAGLHCNTAIPEELERCKDSRNYSTKWLQDAAANNRTPEEHCRIIRCLGYCMQVTGNDDATIRLQKDGSKNKIDIFCKNPSPTLGLEFQVNKGNEGCVLEKVSNMKQGFANPAEVDKTYTTAFGDPRYDKKNYPIFNSMVCTNPTFRNPSDPNYRAFYDNCKVNVWDATKGVREFFNQGNKEIPQRLP